MHTTNAIHALHPDFKPKMNENMY